MEQAEHVGLAFIKGLRDPALKPEHALLGLFKLRCAASLRPIDERLQFFEPTTDLVVYETALPDGQAGIVIVHADGSATAIAVRDGAMGHKHVFEGIGHSLAYAMEIALKGCACHVRSALMWTCAGSAAVDAVIEIGCERAGVIPLPWGVLKAYLVALILEPPKASRGHAQAV